MNSMLKFKAAFLVFFMIFAQPFGWTAEVISGQIKSVKSLGADGVQIQVKGEKGTTTFVVSPSTEVSAIVSVKKVKKGNNILLPFSGNQGGQRGGGKKGWKPFGNMSSGMKKQLGLPNIPGTPDIPGAPKTKPDLPELPQMPEIPKVPKVPKMKKGGEEPDAQQAQSSPQKAPRVQPPVAQPTEEEKNLFGRANENKSLLRPSGEAEVPQLTRVKVLEVQSVKEGVRIVIEGQEGKNGELILSPDKKVVQSLAAKDLREKMAVSVEMAAGGNKTMVQKVVIFE